jgi:amino acid adenylation domain-containing protein
MADTLPDRFGRGLARSPGLEAIRAGDAAISYEAAHERALTWAAALRGGARGTGGGRAAIGILAEPGVRSCVGVLAALYAGAAVVPLRPDFPAGRTARMASAAGISALVADRAGLGVLPALRASGVDAPVLALDDEPIAGDEQDSSPVLRADRGRALTRPCPVAPGDTAFVLFTSGSTGRPKGVRISHANAQHYFSVLDRRYDFGPQDVFSHGFDLSFDCGLFDLFCGWGAGARVVRVPPRAYRDLPGFVAEHGLTVWFGTPSGIGLTRRLGGLAPGSLRSLRWSLFAGETLRCRDAADWQRAAPGSVIENLYGPTELTVTITAHRWSADRPQAGVVNGAVPIGVLHEGHDYLLLGGDGLPCRDEGELCVTGPQRTTGYLDPQDDRAATLSWAGRTWYRTGDRVRELGGGVLTVLGRIDDQVQVRGWRIEPAEIEHAMAACPGIDGAVTVGATDADGTQLVTFYTGRPTPDAELARQLAGMLPHGMLPRHFRHLAELPLGPNRKIDRLALRRQAGDLVAARAPAGRAGAR